MSDFEAIPSRVFASIRIGPEQYSRLSKLIYEVCGIRLAENKEALLANRLQKLCRSYGASDFDQFYETHLKNPGPEILSALVDAISTNHTFFYRENGHFQLFSDEMLPAILGGLKRQSENDIRIWCAAASSGEEPYTLAMLLLEALEKAPGPWDSGILATDISSHILAQAKRGCYTEERIRPLPERLRQRYFRKAEADMWAVSDRLRKEVTFRRFNLMHAFPFKKPFHVIFCRNVMIYFDTDTKVELARKMCEFLVPGGYLCIGHSETLPRDVLPLRYLGPAYYQKT